MLVISWLKITATYILWRVLRRYMSKSVIDNLPGPPSSSRWTGNFLEIFSLDGWNFHEAITRKYGGIVRINALLGVEPLIYVSDPSALHQILVKDPYIYDESSAFIEFNSIVFGKGLVSVMGEQHRKQRKVLNPVFSLANLKAMVPIVYEVGYRLQAAFASKLVDGSHEIDVFHWMSRTSLELIGQTGLGHSFDNLADNKVNQYVKQVKDLAPSFTRLALVGQYILPLAVKIRSPRFWRFIFNTIPGRTDLHVVRDTSDAMYEASSRIYNAKKLALELGNETFTEIGHGKDITSVLMKENQHAPEDEKLSDLDIIGQMSTLIFAAIDTVSVSLSRAMNQLAANPDTQDKLRKEFNAARKVAGGDVPYAELVSLPYLDAVYREIMRLYPPVPSLTRTTTQGVILPLSKAIIGEDGKKINEIPMPKGTNLMISILNANRNPEIWGPDATEWKPERWLTALPDTVTDAHMPGIYSQMLTFSGGKRACIGFKLAELEIKVIVSLLIEKFRFAPLPEKEILWRMSAITTPVVKDSAGNHLTMPLKISLVETTI